MKKTIGLMASMTTVALIGTAAYVLTNDKRTKNAKTKINNMMDDANKMIDKMK